MLNGKWLTVAACLAFAIAAAPPAGAEEQPRLVRKTEPKYPAEAKRQGIEGFVIVRFVIEPNGEVVDAEVVSARPEGLFERAAVECVSEWLYETGGERVRDMMVEVRFKL